MKPVVVITARGGSKRLPRKNVLPFMGKPLIAHSIEYAKREISGIEVFVSTDDAEIKAISEQYGAQVIERPAELASDTATSASVMQHAAQVIKEQGYPCDCLVLLQPTNPLRPKGMLQEALQKFTEVKCRSMVGYTASSRKLLRKREDVMEPVNYHFGQRSQDMERLYFENGLLYINTIESSLCGEIQRPDSYPFVVNHPYGECDIDTIDDFKIAEMFYKLYEE